MADATRPLNDDPNNDLDTHRFIDVLQPLGNTELSEIQQPGHLDCSSSAIGMQSLRSGVPSLG
jgi:hypothetical protein